MQRALKWTRAVAFLVMLASVASAFTLRSGPRGTLEKCTSACGTVTNSQTWVTTNGAYAIVFQVLLTGTVDAKIQNSTDIGVTWTDVAGAACAACTNPQKWSVTDPVGFYRVNISTCTACTYDASFEQARRQ